ncbi:MAG: hypothetical protein AAF789_13005 [Bacteroidota bacterium]
MKKLGYILFLSMFIASCEDNSGDTLAFGDGSGAGAVSGSLASFAIVDDFLYVLTDRGLSVLDIRNEQPAEITRIQVNTDAETIFRYGESLLLGTPTGLLIYDISNRASPTFVSSVAHQTGCDPVIAKDTLAYVTVRSGFTCNNATPVNTLLVVNIADLQNPKIINEIQMLSPRGLTISGDRLYVGEGDFGLKQFNIGTDATTPDYEAIYSEIATNDVIALENRLVTIGSQGVDQLEIDGDTLRLISSIQ